MSTFNELIDFTRFTTGTYLDSVVYGDDKANAFAGSGGPTWTVVDKNTVNGTQPTDTNYFTDIVSGLTIGAQYKIELTITNYAGSGNLGMGSAGGVGSLVRLVGNGTMTSFFTATAVSLEAYMRSTNSGTISVSVKELTGGQVSGTPLLRTAAINEPRLEYDASGNPLGLLIEEARTNAKQYSEVFTTQWSKSATTVTSNSTDTTAPDSTNNATKIQVSGAAETRLRYTASFVQNLDYAFSVFAKAGTSSWLRLRNIGVGDGSSPTDTVWFNLSTGSVGTATSNLTPKIESVGNGWYRCSISGTVINTALSLIDVSVVSGNGFINNNTVGDNIYIYGAQLETGSFPTSYIPTGGSTVTRARDIASLPVERFAYNQPQGSIVCHFTYFFEQNSSSKRTYEFSDGTDSNLIRMIDHNNVNQLQANVRSGNAGVAGILINAPTMLSGVKTFQTYKLNGYSGGADGTLAGTDSNGLLPVGINKLSIGSNRVGVAVMSGHITSLQYYPKKLTNAQLELLTQPSASPTMNLTFDGQATSTLVEGFHD